LIHQPQLNADAWTTEVRPTRKYKVAAYNWGFVAGKTQTNLPWDSWQKPYTDREPAMWFHDIFNFDGKPYRPEEVEFIKQMTGGKGKRK
jgi:hypothetical protein